MLYFFCACVILCGLGVDPSILMHPSAYLYLRVCALGTPAVTLWLIANVIFRRLGKTSTPLK